MENIALKRFAQIVYDYCGLNYVDNLPSLNMKMQNRFRQLEMKTYWEYIRYVENEPVEWFNIVELLTINETYFFREDKQLKVLQQEIMPKLKNNASINIWSAACSTGDEPYSIAMMLQSFIQNEHDIRILGTDINRRVLEVAKKGAYNKNSLSFRRIPKEWIKTYFDETDHQYIIKESLKRSVQFEYTNLCQLEMDRFYASFDIIFCRNVLIYFDDQTIEKIVRQFYDALKPGGYLFLGHAETITKYDIGFTTLHTGGAFYYRKG